MNPYVAGTMTGVVVALGNWAGKKQLGLDKLSAAVFYIIFLMVLSSINYDLASKMSLLVLISAVLVYMIPITQGLGLVKK